MAEAREQQARDARAKRKSLDELADSHYSLGGHHRDNGWLHCSCELAIQCRSAQSEYEAARPRKPPPRCTHSADECQSLRTLLGECERGLELYIGRDKHEWMTNQHIDEQKGKLTAEKIEQIRGMNYVCRRCEAEALLAKIRSVSDGNT